MSTVVCWFQRTLKQLEREQTDTQTDNNYSNPRACAPRVNERDNQLQKELKARVGVARDGAGSMPLSIVQNRTHTHTQTKYSTVVLMRADG